MAIFIASLIGSTDMIIVFSYIYVDTVVRVRDYYIIPVSFPSEGVLSDPSTLYYSSIASFSYGKTCGTAYRWLSLICCLCMFFPYFVVVTCQCLIFVDWYSSSVQSTLRGIFFSSYFINTIKILLNLLSQIIFKNI